MNFRSAIPVLATADYPIARDFWTEIVGFELMEEGGSPPRFGIFKSGDAIVFVDAWHGAPAPHGGWSAYFHVTDVDAFAERLRAYGARFDGPNDTVYEMRELTVRDPDGNVLCFGQDAAA